MKKSDKPILVESLTQSAKTAKSITFVDYQGLNNSQLLDLRRKVRQAGGDFVVAKNTLIKRSLEGAGLKVEDEQAQGLEGPTAVVFAKDDEIAPLQVLGKSQKETELPKLKFGFFNQAFVGSSQLLALSLLPGRQVLQANLVGAMIAPSYALVGALQANMSKLVYILDQKVQKAQ